MQANDITIVDCDDFTRSSKKYHKKIDINEAIPSTVITKFSRYEVLDEIERRVHFDLDGIPFGLNAETMPDRFVRGWAHFMHVKGILDNENIKYVKTTNYHSLTHEGFSSHIICYEYKMGYTELKASVILFVNTEEGKEFKPYVDTAIYSSMRLFKLPHFIGIPMTNEDNYHELDPMDHDTTHYIVQYTKDAALLVGRNKLIVPKGLRKTCLKHSGPKYEKIAKTLEEIKQIFVDKQHANRIYSSEELNEMLMTLINHPRLKENDKARLSCYIPVNLEKSAIIISLCQLVKHKYNFTEDDLRAVNQPELQQQQTHQQTQQSEHQSEQQQFQWSPSWDQQPPQIKAPQPQAFNGGPPCNLQKQ